jgi:hypothetical protein
MKGRDNSVDIATSYGPDGLGIKSRCEGQDFLHQSKPELGPPGPLYNMNLVFPGGKAAGV